MPTFPTIIYNLVLCTIKTTYQTILETLLHPLQIGILKVQFKRGDPKVTKMISMNQHWQQIMVLRIEYHISITV